MNEKWNNYKEKSLEKLSLKEQISLLRKELEKARIEIKSVKSLANEKIARLNEEIDFTKKIVSIILSGLSPEIKNQTIISNFQDEMRKKVDKIIRI